jgi:hypothetical protein
MDVPLMAIYHDDFTIRDVEVYATALEDVLAAFGMEGSNKSYDPMTIEQITTSEGTHFIAHSYAFDLWDGGRHHRAESLEQIRAGMLKEVVAELLAWKNRDE